MSANLSRCNLSSAQTLRCFPRQTEDCWSNFWRSTSPRRCLHKFLPPAVFNRLSRADFYKSPNCRLTLISCCIMSFSANCICSSITSLAIGPLPTLRAFNTLSWYYRAFDHSSRFAGSNTVNVIPGNVEFSLEVRSSADELRRGSAVHIIRTCAKIAKERSRELTSDCIYEQGAQWCDGKLLAELEATTQALYGLVPPLPYGATHDASAMSELWPMAMLFVRCRDGASHLPEKFASEADMEVARQTFSQLVRNLADKYG